MNLNIDILSENLSKVISFKQYGHNNRNMSFKRPLLYDGTSEFKSYYVYVTTDDLLPEHPNLKHNTVIICIGDKLTKNYFDEKCAIFILNENEKIFNIFNIIQMIYDKYDEWDNKLHKIVSSSRDANLLLKASEHIFENPIYIMDDQLNLLAYSPNCKSDLELKKILYNKEKYPFEVFLTFKDYMETNIKKKNVFTYNHKNHNVMCINLFDKDQFYAGIFISDYLRNFNLCDAALLVHLKDYVENIAKQYKKIECCVSNLKEIFINILEGKNDSKIFENIKNINNDEDKYICLKCKMEDEKKVVSSEYICKQIENDLLGSIAIVYNNIIAVFINLKLYKYDYKQIELSLINLLTKMGFKGGISNEFSNIEDARYYFLQACNAVEIGNSYDPELRIYHFEDYIVEYIIHMAASEMPYKLICSKAILKLLNYDKVNNTNYTLELKTYVECNFNAVQTAKKLFIHRSTFLNHLTEINELIDIDLDNPDERMYILFSYKLLEGKPVSKSSNILKKEIN